MNKFFGHLKTINTHRWWVFYYSIKMGIPFRGLVHDLSKFHPTEFFEGVKYYTGVSSPVEECKRQIGVSKAWLHHKACNKHHYEYWQDNFDTGNRPLCMPYKETIEMLCDYLAAGRTYSGKNFSFQSELDWWVSKRDKPSAMHPVQKEFLDIVLTCMASTQELMDKRDLKNIYKECIKSNGNH